MILRLAVMCLCLSACSTASYRGMSETLSFRIMDNHSKQFIYRIERPQPAVGPRPEVPRGAQVRDRPKTAPNEYDYRRLQSKTADVVARVGYCREGYLELDFRLARHVQWIRGECREGASDADIERFGRQGDIPLL